VNVCAEHNPALLTEFKEKAEAYFSALKKNRLKDWLINPKQNNGVQWSNLILRSLILFAGLPVYLTGLIANFPPLWLTATLTRKLVKVKEFYSSFAIGFGMTIFPLTYLLWFFILWSALPAVWWAISACAIFALSGGFCLWYHPFLLRTMGMSKALTNQPLIHELQASRAVLMSLI